jgi:hypothetical protein
VFGMAYKDPLNEIKWRENNRDYHKTPAQRAKQKEKRRKKRQQILKDLPDRYEYNYDNIKKARMKHLWVKRKGLNPVDFERTWDKYVSTDHCETCNISLKKVKKNMDHNHLTGYMRFIVCQRCNGFIRYQDNRFAKVMTEITQR